MQAKRGKFGQEPLLIPIDIDPEPVEEKLTAWGGAALLVQAIRSMDVPGSARRNLHLKQRQRGYDEGAYVESLVVLHALGGECVDDLDRLREDPGMGELLGYEVPSPEAARKFLNRFHDEALMEAARQKASAEGQMSLLVEENTALQGLGQVNRELIAILGARCPEQKIATVDLDSTIIESWKRQAQRTYEGTTGYQPTLALWAEMDLILADEFRDGNVPAIREPLGCAQKAFQALPATVTEYWFRGDAACYEQELLTWLRDEKRAGGPQGRIGFAVSAPMNRELRQEIAETEPGAWKLLSEDATAIKECAVIQYFPEELPQNRYREPLRYIGIRVRFKQREIFEHGREVLHFAVATNLWDWDPQASFGVASREGRKHRGHSRCAQERTGRRSAAVEVFRSGCGVAPFGGDHA